jgi:kynurenine formamidase
MIVDISMAVEHGAVFRRGTPAVRISTETFRHESEGEYESTIISLPAHTATHVDLVYRNRDIAPERMVGKGKLIDVSQVDAKMIQLADIEGQVDVGPGEFVFFRTDWSQLAGTDEYHSHPELSLEIVEWLIAQEVNAVGIDAPGLAPDRRHGELDRLLADHGILVIENLSNLAAIPQVGFTVYCLPLKIAHTDAIPARVLVEFD